MIYFVLGLIAVLRCVAYPYSNIQHKAGMVAGMLFVLAGLFSFLAIPELGLAIAQGVWGGSAVLVSFLWGAVGPTKVRPRALTWSLLFTSHIYIYSPSIQSCVRITSH